MILIDTSVWIAVLRNRFGEAQRLQARLGGQEPVLARFTQLELLQGHAMRRNGACYAIT